MNFASIPSGTAVFLDANVLIYLFTNDLKFGSFGTQLVKRITTADRRIFRSHLGSSDAGGGHTR